MRSRLRASPEIFDRSRSEAFYLSDLGKRSEALSVNMTIDIGSLVILVTFIQSCLSFHGGVPRIRNAPYVSKISSELQGGSDRNEKLSVNYNCIGTIKGSLLSMENNRWGFALFSSNRMTLDSSESDDEEEVTYLNEEQLRAFWLKSGMSAASYNEDTALSKMLLSDNDDDDHDDDDDFNDVDSENEKKNVKRSILSGKKKNFLSSSVASPETKTEPKNSLKAKKSLMLNKLLKRSSKELKNEVKMEISESSQGEKTLKKGESLGEKKVEEVSLDSNGLPIPAGRSVGERV